MMIRDTLIGKAVLHRATRRAHVTLQVPSSVLHREIRGLVVLLDLDTEAYFILDEVGTAMWKAVLLTDDDRRTLRALQAEFTVEPDRLEADLTAFRQRCVEQGFLQEGESKPLVEIPSSEETVRLSDGYTQPKSYKNP